MTFPKVWRAAPEWQMPVASAAAAAAGKLLEAAALWVIAAPPRGALAETKLRTTLVMVLEPAAAAVAGELLVALRLTADRAARRVGIARRVAARMPAA